MHQYRHYLSLLCLVIVLTACGAPDPEPTDSEPRAERDAVPAEEATTPGNKLIVYQIMTRLFGNTESANRPWGTLEENGVGRLADINDAALAGIAELGTTHIWYTGIPRHAVIHDYTEYGISLDDPDVVKGRAGSPFAIRDYFDVHPDLVEDPERRIEEFRELVERTRAHGMGVIIDLVPNHVARNYRSLSPPEGVRDFGVDDDDSVAWARDNSFYYIPGECFELPEWPDDYRPLGGEDHPLADGQFEECPARWTGDSGAVVQPGFNDWYETVRLNLGVTPEGEHAFDEVPAELASTDAEEHHAYWQDRDVPASWETFRGVVDFWLDLGVDGFRYDMAQMVPVAFWSYLNSHVRQRHPEAVLIAEFYEPERYREYLHSGLMDYHYDKVEFYDATRAVMTGDGSTDELVEIHERNADIEHHLLRFLENHDEQRIASPEFAGDARFGKPGMLASAAMGTAPVMLYFGQEVGEPAAEGAGFGQASRTTIFDYFGVPAHQRWMNDGAFDGGQLSEEEQALRDYYVRLMSLISESPAMMGEYADIHRANREHTEGYDDKLLSWLRWHVDEQLLLIANFRDAAYLPLNLKIPAEAMAAWQLDDGEYRLVERIRGDREAVLQVRDGVGHVNLELAPLDALIFERVNE
ncbi:alpha-amylase [Wenzhouxiangella sp. AB-CW3]|uniref:alpha-amylase family glycosyl hydrolase n=1 Tax=Wenzhouxiangella sp. AB-CW3 TaxID=2771012 RepID=UPI00168B3D9D|nr:alpha-amylase family glycosyl hydrolase [Wenzhouxiangella sp. AB-CW3]QOC23020.1 alpha-amylase [Wenzhouxiangella sp. AB-CW3]